MRSAESNPDVAPFLTVYGITVTSIHDVDAEEFSSALDEIQVESGGTGQCQVPAFWSIDVEDWDDSKSYTWVELLGANRDCCVVAHQLMVGVENPDDLREYTIDRTYLFEQKEMWGLLPAGEYVIATGGNGFWQFFDVQFLLHFPTLSTALHIRTWAMPNASEGALDDWGVLIDSISEFSFELIQPTITKYLTAYIIFKELDSP